MIKGKVLDRDGKQKLYVQVYDILKENIEQCEWAVGNMIPTEDDLCRTYDVSKATIREAIAELVRDGYLKRQQGKGTFVICAEPHRGLAMHSTITEDVAGSEAPFRREVIASGVAKPADDVKACLKTDEDVQYFITKRIVGDKAIFMDESFFPRSLFLGFESEDIIHKSIFDLVDRKAGRKIVKVIQTMEVAQVTEDKAAVLDVIAGSPVLIVHRVLVGPDSEPMAYTRLIGSGATYKIQMEFERII
ncbi:MAG TPA: GntR family transcriptional regulator [Dissulfurispiraceae bacterium]|nr:GntR family transcriptional regulator [Dissulfurispiraceae bacterium]